MSVDSATNSAGDLPVTRYRLALLRAAADGRLIWHPPIRAGHQPYATAVSRFFPTGRQRVVTAHVARMVDAGWIAPQPGWRESCYEVTAAGRSVLDRYPRGLRP